MSTFNSSLELGQERIEIITKPGDEHPNQLPRRGIGYCRRLFRDFLEEGLDIEQAKGIFGSSDRGCMLTDPLCKLQVSAELSKLYA